MQTWGRPNIKLFAIGTLLLLLLASSDLQAEATVNCLTVSSGLVNCHDYLTKGAPKPVIGSPCCNGVRGLNTRFVTVSDRQAVCRCFKGINSVLKPNPMAAQRLPGLCGVNLGYAYTPSTDCSRIN